MNSARPDLKRPELVVEFSKKDETGQVLLGRG